MRNEVIRMKMEVVKVENKSERYYDHDLEGWTVEPRAIVNVREKESGEERRYMARNVFDFGLVVHKWWGNGKEEIDGIRIGNADGTRVEENRLYTRYQFYADNKEMIKPNARWNAGEKYWEFWNADALRKIKEAVTGAEKTLSGFMGVFNEKGKAWVFCDIPRRLADEFDLEAVRLVKKTAPAKFKHLRI